MRHKVGMVFQYPEHQLFEETIAEDIAFGPKNLGLSADEVDERVRDAMKFVGLDYDTYAERSPFHLSGGQMRRVALFFMKSNDLFKDFFPTKWVETCRWLIKN